MHTARWITYGQKELESLQIHQLNSMKGCGCGSVGRELASKTRDLQLESQHWHNCIYQLCIEIEKMKIVKKRP